MPFTHKVTFTETVGTPGGNVSRQVTVDVENLGQAAAIIEGTVKSAVLDSTEVTGFNMIATA